MASEQTHFEAMLAAVEAATVDTSVPTPERVRWDQASLGRVLALLKEPGGEDKAKAAWRRALTEVLDERQDMGQTVAVWVLRDRLMASSRRVRYEETASGLRAVDHDARGDGEDAESLSWLFPPGT